MSRLFSLQIQLLRATSLSKFDRLLKKLIILLAILSVFFLIFVLSAATEVVMFTNRSNYLSDAKQRQLTIFRR